MARIRRCTALEIALLQERQAARRSAAVVSADEVTRLRALVTRLQVLLAIERRLVYRPRGVRVLGLRESQYQRELTQHALTGAEHVEAARSNRQTHERREA